MKRNPIVLIHGYSDKGESFKVWEAKLQSRGYDVTNIHTCSYISLTNEVTIKDIAEGLDRAFAIEGGLDPEQEFDAIVHSTGMLVIRAWLTAYSKTRRNRLKHLIGLAPATFGSPLAHKGRSWLGALFKGNREFGPDFLEAGDLVLDALELGSKFTWDLAHKDLLCKESFYGLGADTPYVFTFCGSSAYDGAKAMINEPGTDGTVRFAGCGLNTRKILLDLTKDLQHQERVTFGDWNNPGIAPTVMVKNLNHGSIMGNPSDELVEMVDEALQFSPEKDINIWYKKATTKLKPADVSPWQQFIVRAVDERDDPIKDYHIQLFTKDNGVAKPIEKFGIDVHVYSRDKSLRCFYINLKDIDPVKLRNLSMSVIASSGSQLVDYFGMDAAGNWDAQIDISNLLFSTDIKFFYPFTTTLVELRLNREPCLDGNNKVNKVARFLSRSMQP
jgi:hypothetical protein